MSDDIQKMGREIQDRIREMAYLMWESAGRQQGMAMEYWIAAEKEVLSTMQAAADKMTPPEVKKAVSKTTKLKAAPAKAKSKSSEAPKAAAPSKAEAKPAASEKAATSSTGEPKAASPAKPAARKTSTRAKKTS